MINNVRQLRKIKDVSQEEMAQKIGTTRQNLINIEKERCSPSLKLALRISKYFDKDLRDIFCEEN